MPSSPVITQPPLDYADIDELLGAPPPHLVRYGSALLLTVIMLVVIIAGCIGYTDEITLPATLQTDLPAVVNTPAEKTILQKLIVQNGEAVLPGSPLAVLTTGKGADTLRAAMAGKITLLRTAAGNESLEPATPLFYIDGDDRAYHITIEVPEAQAARITLHQQAGLRLTRFPDGEFGALPATIISLPYNRPGTKDLVADARLTQGLTTTAGRRLQPGAWSQGHVSVVVGRKSLLRSLLHF